MFVIHTLLDQGSANLSNHQANRLQKDTIYIKFYEKKFAAPN
jgi:hypothetical protein